MGNNVKKERVEFLDMLKCVGMFIVVSGHIHPSYGWFSLPLHSYVIPLYFLLSGMTFRREKYPIFTVFLKHRVKTLLIPYLLFSLATWCFWSLIIIVRHDDMNIWFSLIQTVLAQGSGAFLLHNPPLWFIPCLFAIEAMYYHVDKLPEKWNVSVCIAFAIAGTFMMTGCFSETLCNLPWSIEGAFVSIIFYAAGNILTKHLAFKEIESFVVNKKKWMSVCLLVLTPILVISSHWNGHVSVGSDLMGRSPLLFYVNAFVGIVTIFIYSILVCHIASKMAWSKKLHQLKLWLGRNSFYIMAIHYPVKKVIMLVLSVIVGCSVYDISNSYVFCAVTFVATYCISMLISVVILLVKQKMTSHS